MATAPLRVHKFWTEYRPDKDGKLREIDWVTFGPIVGGLNPPTVSEPISRLSKVMPMRGQHDNPTIVMANIIWDYIRPRYEKWKAGEEMPIDGTPLAAWNRLQPQQADVLRAHGFYTVEQIAEISDANMEKFPIGKPRELKKQAQLFLESSDTSRVAALIAEKERTIDSQGEQIAELQEQMRALMASRNAAEDEETEAPRRRGRPPRAAVEDAA